MQRGREWSHMVINKGIWYQEMLEETRNGSPRGCGGGMAPLTLGTNGSDFEILASRENYERINCSYFKPPSL